MQFIQWNIHKSGQKVSEFGLPADATGPFVLSGYSGYKQVQVPRGRLFAFDSEGNYMLTCSATGGVIYKVRGGVGWCHGGLGASSPEGSARLSRASVANPAPHGPGGAFDPGSSKPPKPPAASYSQLRQSSRQRSGGREPRTRLCGSIRCPLTRLCPSSASLPCL